MADIFLEYGVSTDGELVYIGQVPRGRTSLTCPYCGVKLVARKGEKVAAHFAHDGDTCNAASRSRAVIALPYFDRFGVDVPGKVLERLRQWDADQSEREDYQLSRHELIHGRFNGRRMIYELTHKGKIVLGRLSLDLFNKFQEPLIAQRHDELMERARIAQGQPARLARIAEIEAEVAVLMKMPDRHPPWQASPLMGRIDKLNYELHGLKKFDNGIDPQTALTDLRLYRAAWARALACTLYLLEIRHDAGALYKIGVTTRPINERLPEIAADLAPLVPNARIKVVDTFSHRGNVELYFKYRYAEQRAQIGSLTEYFQFDEIGVITRDLRRMTDKVLTDLEHEVLRGEKPAIERDMEASQIEAKRRAAIRVGMRRASHRGEAIGRPRENILDSEFAPRVLAALDAGLSLRKVADAVGVAVNTVRKVQAARDAATGQAVNPDS